MKSCVRLVAVDQPSFEELPYRNSYIESVQEHHQDSLSDTRIAQSQRRHPGLPWHRWCHTNHNSHYRGQCTITISSQDSMEHRCGWRFVFSNISVSVGYASPDKRYDWRQGFQEAGTFALLGRKDVLALAHEIPWIRHSGGHSSNNYFEIPLIWWLMSLKCLGTIRIHGIRGGTEARVMDREGWCQGAITQSGTGTICTTFLFYMHADAPWLFAKIREMGKYWQMVWITCNCICCNSCAVLKTLLLIQTLIKKELCFSSIIYLAWVSGGICATIVPSLDQWFHLICVLSLCSWLFPSSWLHCIWSVRLWMGHYHKEARPIYSKGLPSSPWC